MSKTLSNGSVDCWSIDDLIWTFDVSVTIRMKKTSPCSEVGLAKMGVEYVLQTCLAKILGRGSVPLSELGAPAQKPCEVEIRSLQIASVDTFAPTENDKLQ